MFRKMSLPKVNFPISEPKVKLVTISEPSFIIRDNAYVNFLEKEKIIAEARFSEAAEHDDSIISVIEVYLANPRGVSWITLEFLVSQFDGDCEVNFDARMIPPTPVVIKLYGAQSEIDIQTIDMNHRLNPYKVDVTETGVEFSAQEARLRLGFTLPQHTWFVFQLLNLRIRPARGGGTA